jgi:predicted nucleic acid-binding protein
LSLLIDTNIAVHARDGSAAIRERLLGWGVRPWLSMASVIELHGGLYGDPSTALGRRAGLNRLLAQTGLLHLDEIVVEQYGDIVRANGFSRTRVFDRLIAATALVHDLTLVTINGADFRDIPGLNLEVWPVPAQ